MIPAESPSAPSPKGDDTFAARRLLLGVSSLGRDSSSSCSLWLAGAFLCLALSGCTVIAVTGTAISVTAGAVGLAADAAIGTAKIVGKGVGKAADALMDDDKPEMSDASGVNIRYRDSAAFATLGSEMPASAATATPVAPASALQPEY